MSTPAEIVADWLRDSFNVMDCSFNSQRDAYYEGGADALGALALAGYAVVRLPEPDYTDDGGHGYNRAGVFAHSGRVYDEDTDWSPDDARQIGTAWLAAAYAAEAGDSDA